MRKKPDQRWQAYVKRKNHVLQTGILAPTWFLARQEAAKRYAAIGVYDIDLDDLIVTPG